MWNKYTNLIMRLLLTDNYCNIFYYIAIFYFHKKYLERNKQLFINIFILLDTKKKKDNDQSSRWQLREYGARYNNK